MIYKGSELWNKKLIEISKNGILRSEAFIKGKQEEKVDRLKLRRREKEKSFILNKDNLQTEEEIRRLQNLRNINLKSKKVLAAKGA